MKGHITKEQLSDSLKQEIESIGDKDQLQTENKDNIVNAINEVFQSGVNVKNNMVQAINSKITVPDINTNNTWNDIVSSVKNIKEAQGNAVVADVISGKTFTNSTGELLTGTIVNRGGATTVTPTTTNQTKAAGYYSGAITIKGDSNLVAANIVSGKSIFGVAGSAKIGVRATIDGVVSTKNITLTSVIKEFISKSTVPYNFYEGSAVVLNNEIHILGSSNSINGSKYTNHYKYNGSSWSSVSTLPYNFYNGSAVVLNNEIHILGSSNSNTTSNYTKHYKYNGSSWSSVSTLPYNFYNGSAVVYNNEIHILGTGNTTSNYTKHYKYNGKSWSSVSTLPYNFNYGSAVVLNNEIHILGSGESSHHTKHYKYNGSSWTKVSTLPYKFYNGSAVVYNNEIHILGSGGSYTNHYKYNGSSWSSVSTLPYNFYNGSAVVYNNEIHILGSGNSSSYTKHYYAPLYYQLSYN